MVLSGEIEVDDYGDGESSGDDSGSAVVAMVVMVMARAVLILISALEMTYR